MPPELPKRNYNLINIIKFCKLNNIKQLGKYQIKY